MSQDNYYASSNQLVLDETTVVFNEGFAAASLATAKEVAITLTDYQPDAMYQIEIYNPSTTSDIVVDAYNVSTYKSAEASPGVAATASDVYIGTKTAAKQVITANVDTLPSKHILNLQGFCMGDSSKLLIKNTTQIAAAQVQTTLLTGTLDSGTVLFEIKNAAGVTKSSLNAQQIQTVTIAGTALEAGDTFILSVLGADGVTTYPTAALAYDIAAADLKTAVEALLVTAGWSRSNLGDTATTITASDTFQTGVTITFTAGTTGTSMIPVFTAVASRAGATIVFAQTPTTVAYNADVATLKAAYEALLELAGWVTSAGAALEVTFTDGDDDSVVLTTSGTTITYAASVSTVVPVPTFTCSKAATYITLRTTTYGATPVSVKVRKI